MSRVFVVQQQMKFDGELGGLVPKFDVGPAEKFGKIVYLLSPTASPFKPASVIKDLHNKLADFSDKDYLLLTGNPCLIGMACAIAADYNNGHISMLQWSGKDGRYLVVESGNLFAEQLPS